MKMKNSIKKIVAGTVAMVAAPAAFAGELATAVTGELDKAELTLIGVGVLALAGVVALIRAGRKSAGG